MIINRRRNILRVSMKWGDRDHRLTEKIFFGVGYTGGLSGACDAAGYAAVTSTPAGTGRGPCPMPTEVCSYSGVYAPALATQDPSSALGDSRTYGSEPPVMYLPRNRPCYSADQLRSGVAPAWTPPPPRGASDHYGSRPRVLFRTPSSAEGNQISIHQPQI